MNFENIIKLSKSLNRSLKTNYLNEHLTNNIDTKTIDTTINTKVKVKIFILGEVIVSAFYHGAMDTNHMGLLGQRLTEAFHNLLKTKKLKIEILLKRYNDIELIMDDFIYLLDPRLRVNQKPETFTLKDMASVGYF
jgi:hypothetical protein